MPCDAGFTSTGQQCAFLRKKGENGHTCVSVHVCVYTYIHIQTVAPSVSQWEVNVLFGRFALRLVFRRVLCWGAGQREGWE